MPIDPEKLAKLQKASAKKVGGQRIKAKKVNKSAEADDTQLQNTLKKLNAQTLDGVEEANFFKDDGTVLHFNRVGVQAAAAHNTYTFSGFAQQKNITELIPGILPQLGAENLSLLQKIAESFQQNQGAMDALKASAGGEAADEEIPELVEGETFEDDVE
ncbi:hypothetical protein CANARDRAFT_8566 [[Candida] arabinofermentans NRRL YB-2248]|uniref:Nascent polypeptide-associated complex subunit beta n=1 Tax=[Candida] arabinofermentans NRRL YB-2248 TaxID=983967 RepID=A0A1E4SYK3_9ASCO|nr:hypothetical protein CANARDRAFT_8566 [[Candida] arabinofermentans NRRL YB-2248]